MEISCRNYRSSNKGHYWIDILVRINGMTYRAILTRWGWSAFDLQGGMNEVMSFIREEVASGGIEEWKEEGDWRAVYINQSIAYYNGQMLRTRMIVRRN